MGRPSATIADVVSRTPANTIAEVIERLHAIDASLRANDGVAWFTKLYLRVTEAVEAQMADARGLRDPAFLARLDVVFANLYFDTLGRAARDPATVPKAWTPLFEARTLEGIAPIQFALAGMNAHINRDLPVALAATSEELHLDLAEATPEFDDFRRLNALLERTEHEVKTWFATGFVGIVDSAFGDVDDRVAMWDVARARDAAWVQAQTLWALRALPKLQRRFMETLDHVVGFAGRGLLVPAG